MFYRICLFCSLIVGPALFAEPLAEVTDRLEERLGVLEAEEELELSRLGRLYMDRLDSAFAEARQAGDLDRVSAVMAERDRFNSAKQMPDVFSEDDEVRRLQTTYQTAAHGIRQAQARKRLELLQQLDQYLQQMERVLTSEGDISGALEVRQKRQALQEEPWAREARALAGETAAPVPRQGGSSPWVPVQPLRFTSQANNSADFLQPDGSIHVLENAPRDTYVLAFLSPLPRITGIQVEALTDPRLPSGGPGRAPNGNFVLNRIALIAPGRPQPTRAEFNDTAHRPFGVADGCNGSGGGK